MDDKRHFAQDRVQKTRDFGQNDGATGAGLHHFRRKSDVYLNVRPRCCGSGKFNPKNENGAALATPLG
ncbi:hypothetical protein [Ruegeria sp. HKCCA5463]|uniref:hypothetical protein n=1 Tax=Ruegeria sp. HKCCA5463 TaxID=2682994 RepID=UPI001C2CBBEA|nr:hypothetical protein [Ruegeria sp. HKCCA5463]